MRLQSGRLRYQASKRDAGLSESEFAELVGQALGRLQGRRLAWAAPIWLAAAVGAGGVANTEYEVLVFFSQRTRMVNLATRIGLGWPGWSVAIGARVGHGQARKDFFRDELERWSDGGRWSQGCFGTGLEKLGVCQGLYEVAGRGGFRRVG